MVHSVHVPMLIPLVNAVPVPVPVRVMLLIGLSRMVRLVQVVVLVIPLMTPVEVVVIPVI